MNRTFMSIKHMFVLKVGFCPNEERCYYVSSKLMNPKFYDAEHNVFLFELNFYPINQYQNIVCISRDNVTDVLPIK